MYVYIKKTLRVLSFTYYLRSIRSYRMYLFFNLRCKVERTLNLAEVLNKKKLFFENNDKNKSGILINNSEVSVVLN